MRAATISSVHAGLLGQSDTPRTRRFSPRISLSVTLGLRSVWKARFCAPFGCVSGTFGRLGLNCRSVNRRAPRRSTSCSSQGSSRIGLWTGLGDRRTRSNRFGLVRATRDI